MCSFLVLPSDCVLFFLLHSCVHRWKITGIAHKMCVCVCVGSAQIKLQSVNLCNQFVLDSNLVIRNAQCISSENSIRFGIDQSILRWLSVGYIDGHLLRLCLRVQECTAMGRPFFQLTDSVNVSISVEKSAFAISKLFHISVMSSFFSLLPFTLFDHAVYQPAVGGVLGTRDFSTLCE